jgi:hypothetical protein
MIRIYMPDGQSKKVKGRLSLWIAKPGEPMRAAVRLQDGRVLQIDSIAMVFRGKRLAYTPRMNAPTIRAEADNAFLLQHKEWGIAHDGMPLRRQVVAPHRQQIQAGEIAKEILSRA